MADKVDAAFRKRFGEAPRLFQAPGRINIIGEHTDYSEGIVMPAAINRSCIAAIGPNADGATHVLSLNRNEEIERSASFNHTGSWSDYVAGCRAALAAAGIETPGCNLVIGSDVPEGAGVSSSAALEVSVVTAMLALTGRTMKHVDVARIAQAAESVYVGMPCGIMDQFISVYGREGHALMLDCRSLTFEAVPAPASAGFLVIDSQVRHKLTDGGYAARRADCEAAASLLGVRVLRDVRSDQLSSGALPERLLRRARHVVSENARVQAAQIALAQGDVIALGALMNDSHASLRDDFDVTCAETDTLAAIACGTPGVLGARQMGGGFGGAVLALVAEGAQVTGAESIVSGYRAATGLDAEWFHCRLADGAREILP
ncbi:MAG: galactokinase [Alphaproteobacteria bacterium]